MRELFATLPDNPPPPLASDYLDRVLTRGRRAVRLRRAAVTAAWVAVLLVFASLLLPGAPHPARPAAPVHRATLPDHLAGYSVLTSTAERSAPGRAIALYGYGNGETFNMFQQLIVGADADTYRRVGSMEERDRAQGLLSPDGTRVVVGDDRGPTSDLLIVDFTTGRRRSIALGASFGVRLLAWSPDGRYVAYSVAADSGADAVIRTGTLRLLDVATGHSTEFAAVRAPYTAAFAPDSTRLAVQVDHDVHLLDLAGLQTGVVPVGTDRALVPGVGWTPDGRFLVTLPHGAQAMQPGTFLLDNVDATFVALTPGTEPPAPLEDVLNVLGWRDATHAIAATLNTAGSYGQLALTEIDLTTGARRQLARFDTGMTCELHTQHCLVFDLQLATGLLPDLTVRTAHSPDRGPWPWTLRLPIAVLLTAAAALTAWATLRYRARRSAPSRWVS